MSRVTITIPAKSYVARVDAENRKIETAVEGVSLYTVKNVTDSEVELTAELNVVAAEMPYLIYNDKDEEVTISIVLTTDEADDVQYDDGHQRRFFCCQHGRQLVRPERSPRGPAHEGPVHRELKKP